MKKTHLTRKNLIFLALLFFFLFLQAFVFCCLDTTGMMNPKNPIVGFAALMGFLPADMHITDYVAFFLVNIYTFIFAFAILYEVRMAKMSDEKPWGRKYILAYVITLVVYLLLSFGLSFLLQIPYTLDKFVFQMSMLYQTFLLAFVIYAVLGSLIFATLALFVNFKNIDKPFKFFGKKAQMIEEAHEQVEIAEAQKEIADFDLNATFGKGGNATGEINAPIKFVPAEGVSSFPGSEHSFDRTRVFPGLCMVDQKYELGTAKIETSDVSLKDLCDSFRNYLAHEKLYFEENTIRQFISALGTTRLVILEGLSGTGKSSLPRYLANFMSCDSFFVPVQSTWRDRTNLIGFFNEFSKTFTETEFLINLYEANYNPDKLHFYVLDEMNISRIEYYFADFLSVLEYPVADWKLKVMQLPFNFVPPAKLNEGIIQIPENAYFVGTANKDDSTFTITDKVYDRAITIDFDNRNDAFEVQEEVSTINISASYLKAVYEAAQQTTENQLTKADLDKFTKITNFIYEQFDIAFGNRILAQIEKIVPVFVQCGGKKEDALDFLLSRKVISKIEGRFEDYVKGALKELLQMLENSYGKGVFKRSEKTINGLMRRL